MSIAPSLCRIKRGVGTAEPVTNGGPNGTTGPPYPYHTDPEPNNPTVIPRVILEGFHFTFLIRHPRSSIPSYYRCTVPPLDEVTGFHDFMPSEAGYDEVRRLFDYLRSINQIGPHIAGREIEKVETNGNSNTNGDSSQVEICVLDADDLLDNPSGIIEAYCRSVGIDYHHDMLKWDSEDDHHDAIEAFAKWKGFHEDAINSTELKARLHTKKIKSDDDQDSEWREKFGEKGAKIIRDSVNANIKDYEYLKQFALSV
ncbi:hypothetical protein MMC29_002713 [Sticta canariensis]|nr:hypothetical protein [Sticta canariensis]